MKKGFILLGIGTFLVFTACDDRHLSEEQRLKEGTRVGAPSTEDPHTGVSPGISPTETPVQETPGAGTVSPEEEATAEESPDAQEEQM